MPRKLSLVALDAGAVAVAAFAAQFLRDNLFFSFSRMQEVAPYAALSLCVSIVVVPALGLDRRIWRFSNINDLVRILAAVIAIILLTLVVSFSTFRLTGVARSIPILHGVIAFLLMSAGRLAARYLHVKRENANFELKGRDAEAEETIVVVGVNEITRLFLASVAEYAPKRIVVAGLLAPAEQQAGRIIQGSKILGVPESAVRVLETLSVAGVEIDRIVVTLRFEDLSEEARNALSEIEKSTSTIVDYFSERIGLGKDIRGWRTSSPGQTDNSPAAARATAALQTYSLGIESRPWFWRSKRMGDIILAGAVTALVMPVIMVVAAIVAVDLGLPVLFMQQRPGTNRRPFKVFKFRTMAAPHDHLGQRIADEFRTGQVGLVLRRLRLDELPQLFNILLGQMSFVGPRPLLPKDQPIAMNARLIAPPGLTGWAQVNGGRNVSALDKVALDLWYIKNASFVLDLEIMLRTGAVLLGNEQANDAVIDRAWQEINTFEQQAHLSKAGENDRQADEAVARAKVDRTSVLVDAAE